MVHDDLFSSPILQSLAFWLMLRLPKIFLSGPQDLKSFSFSLCTLYFPVSDVTGLLWIPFWALDTQQVKTVPVVTHVSEPWGQSEPLTRTKTQTITHFLF